MGAALALEVAGLATSPKAGAETAAHAIDSGQAKMTLDKIGSFARE
jgi:anthranilate phosphoribosyltransferase